MRDLENQLAPPPVVSGPAAAGCGMGPAGVKDGKLDVPGTMAAMYQMVAVALRCDITRAATFDFYDDGGGDGNSFSWLGVSRDYHQVAHAGKGDRANKMNGRDRQPESSRCWPTTSSAPLDQAMEGTGSVLDHSVVVYGNGMNSGAGHSVARIPFLIIGSGGGYFKTGRVMGTRQRRRTTSS